MNNLRKSQLASAPLLQKCNDHDSNRNIQYSQILTQKERNTSISGRRWRCKWCVKSKPCLTLGGIYEKCGEMDRKCCYFTYFKLFPCMKTEKSVNHKYFTMTVFPQTKRKVWPLNSHLAKGGPCKQRDVCRKFPQNLSQQLPAPAEIPHSQAIDYKTLWTGQKEWP